MKNSFRMVVSVVSVAILLAIVFLLGSLWYIPKITQGSVVQGNEYNSTTTAFNLDQESTRVLKGSVGALAQVTVTGSSTGTTLDLYDATTSDATLRSPQFGTSTILIASFTDFTTPGTYTFDATFYNGLLMVQSGGGTSTITWR